MRIIFLVILLLLNASFVLAQTTESSWWPLPTLQEAKEYAVSSLTTFTSGTVGNPPGGGTCNPAANTPSSSMYAGLPTYEQLSELASFVSKARTQCQQLAIDQGISKKENGVLVPNIPSTDFSAIKGGQFPYCDAGGSTSVSSIISTQISSSLACMRGGSYGFFVDGIWGDLSFLGQITTFVAYETGRAGVAALPGGEYLLSQLGVQSHRQMLESGTETMMATYEKVQGYLKTEQGREQLSIAYCYGIDTTFQQHYQANLMQKFFQELVNKSPAIADDIRNTPCSEVAGFLCQMGGMVGYELVSDSLIEAGAGALVAGGVVTAGTTSAVGGAVGIAAIGKSLLKFLKKSADLFWFILDYAKKFLSNDMFESLLKYLSKQVPGEVLSGLQGLSSAAKKGDFSFVSHSTQIPKAPSVQTLPLSLSADSTKTKKLILGENLGGNIEGANAITNGKEIYGTPYNLVQKEYRRMSKEDAKERLDTLIDASNSGEGPVLVDYILEDRGDGSFNLKVISENVTDISSRSSIVEVVRGDGHAQLADLGKKYRLGVEETIAVKQQVVIDSLRVQMRHDDGHPLNYFTRIVMENGKPKVETVAIDLDVPLKSMDELKSDYLSREQRGQGSVLFNPKNTRGPGAQYNFYYNLERICKDLQLLRTQCQDVITPEVLLGM